ncbi:MAG: AAA family ATPase [Polyangiaceae bacterium]|nr:AAA family ATPase [Polyangiaceae bacterium]
MRLRELGLVRFGGFTDRVLDLSAPGLQLVFGKNEAGKSTALRGITALLYGVPHVTGDAYLHDELLLSARVRARDGSELSFTRRKGRKNTLRSASGEVLDEASLTHLLGGVNQAMFETTFGLDHQRLRQGGEELTRGGGEVGRTLFDAGIGGGSVKRVLDELEAEAERLFTPRARTRGIAEALREYGDKLKQVRAESTRPEAWAQQRQALESARVALVGIDERRAEHKRLLSAAQELVKALPLLARRDGVVRALAAVASAPHLPDGAVEQRVALERELDSTLHDARTTQEQLAEVERELGTLRISEQLLSLDADRVDDLHGRLGQYRGDRSQLSKRRGELAAAEASVRRRLAALGKGAGEDPRSLLPERAEATRIKLLAREWAKLDVELGQGRAREARARAEVAEHEARAAAPADLGMAGAPPDVLDRPLPSPEAIDELARRLEQLEHAGQKLAERRAAVEADLDRARTELTALELAGPVPTEAELDRARAARAAAFDALRAAVAAGSTALAEPIADLEQHAHAADRVADRLRREAERVARFAAAEARRRQASERLAALGDEAQAIALGQAALAEEWRATWSPSGLDPKGPREMRALAERWQRARERRADAAAALARARALLDEASRASSEHERARSAWAERWAEAVARLGLTRDAAPEEADDVLSALTELGGELELADGLRHRVQGMEQTAHALEREVADLVARHLPDLAESGDFEQRATTLIQQSRATREAARRRADLEARRARAVARQAELCASRQGLEQALERLVAAAGVPSRAALPAAEAASATRRRAQADLAEVDAQLCQLCGTADLEQVRSRAEGVSLLDARARVVELEEALREIEDERDAVRDQLSQAARGLELFDDRQTAADAQVEAEALLAKIRSDAERWARVKIAWRVLSTEVERYRATHQAPLLARASELFPRLTHGRYQRLTVDHDAEPPVLCAVAADGGVIPIPSLSEGTRDQLYLALRLASLEHYAAVSEPLPLCLDDVLINFDDDRAHAALEVLAEVAQRMQVLLFTHHEHVVTAARATLGDKVTVHELVRREVRAAAAHAPPA